MKTTLLNQEFSSKTALYDHVKLLMIRLKNQTVKSDHEDFKFIMALVKRHHNTSGKIGTGVKAFRITTNRSNTPHLDIIRLDDSVIDISWVGCCKINKKRPIRVHLNRAMRNAVEEQIFKFKKEYKTKHGNYKCGLCKTTDAQFQVDHEKPIFNDLFKQFVVKNPDHPTQFDQKIMGMNVFRNEDKEYDDKWKKYHQDNAKLRLLCAECNRKYYNDEHRTANQKYYYKNRTAMIQKVKIARLAAVGNKKYLCEKCDKTTHLEHH